MIELVDQENKIEENGENEMNNSRQGSGCGSPIYVATRYLPGEGKRHGRALLLGASVPDYCKTS